MTCSTYLIATRCSWSFSTASAGMSAEDIKSRWCLVIRLSPNHRNCRWRLLLSDLNTRVSKLIFVITGEHGVHAWYDLHLSAGLLLKRPHKGGIYFYVWIWPCLRDSLSLCVAILTITNFSIEKSILE